MGQQIKRETKLQVDTFALIRFLSAIAIVLYHYNKLTGGMHSDPQLPWYFVLQLAYVHGGKLVELFFIISGFCFVVFYKDQIMHNEIQFRNFMIHRFFKILPSYWLSTLLIIIFSIASNALIDSMITGAGRSMTEWLFLPLNFLCLDFANPINGVAWFLTVNLICYVLYYFILRFHRGKVVEIVSSITIIGASILVYQLEGNVFQNIARGAASFGVGGGIAVINNSIVKNVHKQRAVVIMSVLSMFVALFGLSNLDAVRSYIWIVEVYFLFPAIIFFVTNLKSVRNFLSRSQFQIFGAYSYTIYIFQTVVMIIIFLVCGLAGHDNWYTEGSLLIALLSIIGVGIVMYELWERPIRNHIKRLEEKIK